jgi:hypothetical protein
MRKETIRLEDNSQAYNTVRRVLLLRNPSFAQQVEAAALLALLAPKQQEELLAIAELKLAYRSNSKALADPQAIIRQNRHSAKPSGIYRRNIRDLWAPRGYLPPAIRLRRA